MSLIAPLQSLILSGHNIHFPPMITKNHNKLMNLDEEAICNQFEPPFSEESLQKQIRTLQTQHCNTSINIYQLCEFDNETNCVRRIIQPKCLQLTSHVWEFNSKSIDAEETSTLNTNTRNIIYHNITAGENPVIWAEVLTTQTMWQMK